MKKLRLSEANAPLREYVKRLEGSPLILTAKGKASFALVPITGVDLETVSIHTDPAFLDVLKHSDEQAAVGKTIPLDEMRRHLDLEE